jgi:hypothetical protein
VNTAVGLERFLRPAPKPRAGERCEMCGVDIADEHGHVVNLESRNLMCTCRPCALLFAHDGASQGRYRAVPERYLYDPDFQIADAVWDTLQIPVSMAFFFLNSRQGEYVAFYPSPAGATESMLPLDTWRQVLDDNPALGQPEPDVEALLVFRHDGRSDCFLVPIDACYELVGRVRMRWKGFDGGQEAWADIDAFFAALQARSRRPAQR